MAKLPPDLPPEDLDELSMGCTVSIPLCPHCLPPPIPVADEANAVGVAATRDGEDLKLISVSFVSPPDRALKEVAEHAGVTEERLHEYLSSDEQNGELFRAYHYITGCYPVGKHG